MSITDELMEYTEKQIKWLDMTKVHYRKLFSIADRIDAEHEEALLNVHIDLMDARGWVRLPKDADGEYIHIGDVMDSKVDYLFDGKPFTVRAIVLCEDGWEAADGRFGNRYKPDSLRHHHAPTVEDVLREFVQEFIDFATCIDDHEVTDAIEQYAKRLKLAEGEGE